MNFSSTNFNDDTLPKANQDLKRFIKLRNPAICTTGTDSKSLHTSTAIDVDIPAKCDHLPDC